MAEVRVVGIRMEQPANQPVLLLRETSGEMVDILARLAEQPAPDLAPGAVVEVFQPGYELLGRLVRPAMVIVSAKGSTGEAPADAPVANPYAHPEGEPDGAGAAVDRKA